LKTLLRIEADMGRVRERPMTARVCDLDLLLWGDEMIMETELIVPHPRLHMRKFVLIPLCDLIPDVVHPAFNRSFSALLAGCADPLHVWPVKPKHI
jgi:2-amino-4-hydroxy-6-hydroxymethyldihydropteridine diphosphokinase